ncbi:MAG TPA: hypothetical protein VFS62_12210 [Chloroflexota bacterium]|nr:hypothetical protein [Chloroflexota bacterium]
MSRQFAPALGVAFVAGLGLLIAGQLVSDPQLAAALSLLGGALLIAVAIRALAGLAGLHRTPAPALQSGETLLLEEQDVRVRTGFGMWGSWRGTYRARLTNRRIMLSLRVFLVTTNRDVTVAWLEPGQVLSLARVEIDAQNVRLVPARRFGSAWTLRVGDPGAWRAALLEAHPELLR